MDHFLRFINPHVFLGCVQFLQLQTSKENEALLGTRLFERLIKIGVSQEKIDQIMQQDNLNGKLASVTELLKLRQRALIDYVQENLWTVEEAYQALIILFDQGQYEKATEIVDNLYPCVEATEKLNHLKNGFLWARLNCKLIGLFKNTNNATTCIEAIKDLLKQEDQIKYNFKQRANLLHAGVLVCFISDDTNAFLELFSGEQFLEVVHTIAPYLLYYYTVALLINQQFNGNTSLAIIGTNANKSVPHFHLLNYVEEIIVKFQFNNAIKMMNDISTEIDKDFIVKSKKAIIINACKLYFFSTYIKIFNGVQIKQFSTYLQLNEEETESWLVNAIRTLNINAKIDGDKIIVQKQDINAQNTQLLKQLRDLQPKSNMLISNLQRIINIK
ncbi:unnamed protein product [Paramecium primaurelia]|uniref:PCI domain-containing protein n=1 Tax=Paramecium primaurelia TaxID=5886 RepID=A0A8S1LS46_PARPR|nr:unnamed protein product [Paramecium primaurelia]